MAASACAVADAPENVLFVGNSFTYYNNGLQNHYRALVRSASPDNKATGKARIMTISGGRLPEHAGGLPGILASEEWDVVVLQGHSLGPINEETSAPFRGAARDFATQISDSGARPVFFMTWAYTSRPEMTATLDAAFTSIGNELNAQVVPVGLAFAAVRKERDDIKLISSDDKHPRKAGTYLAACTFYAALQGKSPEGLDYDAGLDKEVAGYLQSAAWQAVQNYEDRQLPPELRGE